jgi:hypothetical protein
MWGCPLASDGCSFASATPAALERHARSSGCCVATYACVSCGSTGVDGRGHPHPCVACAAPSCAATASVRGRLLLLDARTPRAADDAASVLPRPPPGALGAHAGSAAGATAAAAEGDAGIQDDAACGVGAATCAVAHGAGAAAGAAAAAAASGDNGGRSMMSSDDAELDGALPAAPLVVSARGAAALPAAPLVVPVATCCACAARAQLPGQLRALLRVS